jgi:hypothetical protein
MLTIRAVQRLVGTTRDVLDPASWRQLPSWNFLRSRKPAASDRSKSRMKLSTCRQLQIGELV